MTSFEKNLEKYAELGVKIGVNIQPGQTLVVNAPISAAKFVRLIAKSAYGAGAKNVHVEWSDDELTRIKYDQAPDEAFKEFPLWKAKGFEELAEGGAAFLSVVSTNPDLLEGVDVQKIATASKAAGMALKKFRNYTMTDQVAWSIVAIPSEAWAAKVFPEAEPSNQVDMLWEAIFKATRVDQDDPVQAWKVHDTNLQEKVQYLNNKKYKRLYYKAPGTDLTIELPEGHIWIGGGGANKKGVYFFANMPTEEVFTLPLREGITGTVSSTKPLNYQGSLINNFKLTFEKGRIVDFSAEKGYDNLKHLIETDEGSHYLGEVALVPHNSPISQSNLIFFNTLFDENASCHLAIGSAYTPCLEGGADMKEEELVKRGANTSLTHVDFMVGSAELDIDGETADGKLEPVFRKGNWAF